MRQTPTGTVTFLFTDIAGSTRLWETHPDAMRPALARHDALIREAVLGGGGYVFKTLGDGVCAAFPTGPAALDAALAAQIALHAEPWALPTPLAVRMALHTGACEDRDGDYFGPPLNRVARLLAAGHGGQTLLSAATQELVRDTTPPGVSLRDLGDARLKDLGRPEHVFQLLHPGLPADFPPLRSLDNPALPNNLPQQATSFIGREKELAEVGGLLARTRLLTLTGAGGCGKTRLALQAAADLLDGEGEGVRLVELAPLADPARVPQAVADALGVKEQPGTALMQTLTDWLRPRRLLLVLDNCEHLIAACASLAADLLRACPGVHLLATSREPLGVSGEQTYRVPSLSSPDPRRVQTLEALSQYEAVRLFIERARAVRADFAVTDASAPAVAQVCFHLDGIPLAIELAAARVRSLPVEEINTRLDNRFKLLTGGARTALPRQQTLRALIDWSYDLLTEQEKTLFRRLSVFAGGWTLEAAEAVCAGASVADGEVLDLLTSLVDKSLVVYDQDGDGGARSRLLETVRRYAGDRLAEGEGAGAVQARAAAWALALAEESQSKMLGPGEAAWLARLETEHDNLRAALAWYEAESESTPRAESAPEGGLRLAGALARFWAVRGHYAEGRQWLGRALGRGTPAGADALRAGALFGAGYLAYSQGDFGAAQTLYAESLALYRLLGQPRGVGAMLDNLGNVAYERGDLDGAQALYEESLGVRRGIGDEGGIASALGNMGNVAHERGDLAGARALHEECLVVQRSRGDRRGAANSLNNLGNVAYDRGDHAGARALHEESLGVQRTLGNRRGVANSLVSLGLLACDRGDPAAGGTLLRESLTIRRDLGDRSGIAHGLHRIARLAQDQGHPARAARLWAASSALRETLGSPLDAAERADLDGRLAAARSALGGGPFTAAWDAGRALTADQAVAEALADGE